MNHKILSQNQQSWNTIADDWFGTTALPTYGPTMPTENDLQLFQDINHKKVLDIGCGSGHSLKWCGDHGASELWGMDLSEKQIQNAEQFLSENNYYCNLYVSPMEKDCGIPKNYFDIVYSIYAIGWTTDLRLTFQNVASYLKKGGCFIFSWDHPFMHCVDIDSTSEPNRLIFSGNYLEEDIFTMEKGGQPLTLQNRKLSTYINTLADCGLSVEKVIEETDVEILARDTEFNSRYYADCKAQKFPLSFIMKARKL